MDPESDEYREAAYAALFDKPPRKASDQYYIDEIIKKLVNWAGNDNKKKNLKDCISEVKKVRNSINHFGILMKWEKYGYQDLEEKLYNGLKIFLDITKCDCRFS